MSRQSRISAFVSAITGKLNTLKSQIGDLTAGLSTTDKSSLVAAINEVKATADAAGGGGVTINDGATNSTEAWSGSKVNSEITSAISTALEGEDVSDLADAIGALQAADLGLVSASASQSFTTPQQDQARNNIAAAGSTEMGNAEHDFVAEFNALISF